jgi:tripartite ATP-independent transporter DctM subunit
MGVEIVTILMFAFMILLLATGIPIVFAIGSTAIVFAYIVMGPPSLGILPIAMYNLMNNFVLIAIPLFIFMGNILERSGVADDLFSMIYKWFGRVPGGLAMGTVLICTVFGAMAGVSAAATVTMGVIALPSMLKRGYEKRLVVGAISAGGALGQLIPPSIAMIVWSLMAEESAGQMFLGGVIPGLILSSMFIAYIAVKCFFNPEAGPPISDEERPTWREKVASLRAVVLPILIIIGVLGSIFGGIATPTEAAAIGALGSVVSARIYRRLSWATVSGALYSTLKLTSMIMWITVAGACFSAVFSGIGAQQFLLETIQGLGVNRWTILVGMQIIYLFLGMVMEPNSIIMLSVPIFVPVIKALGFDSLWFGVLFVVNMEMGFISPPFGLNLFYMKAVVPEDVTMVDLYRSVIPFIIIQAFMLVIAMMFPQIILYLPDLMLGK